MDLNVIIVEQDSGNINDFYIIPFSKTINDCMEDYKSKIKSPLLPLIFRNKNIIKNMSRLFIPALVLDLNSNGNIVFISADRNKVNKVVETKKYKTLYEVNFDFKDVPINMWSKLDDSIFNNICNYDFNKNKVLEENLDLIKDDRYVIPDITDSSANDKVHSKVLKFSNKIVKETIEHKLKKLENNELKVDYTEAKKVLLPIYMLKINYKNKDYVYVMNGDTGKSYFKKTYSIIALIVFSLLIFTIIFLISYLLAYFL